ncbi:MAG: hypothetical protein R3B06_15170 [Kofleriaceae bacterium]
MSAPREREMTAPADDAPAGVDELGLEPAGFLVGDGAPHDDDLELGVSLATVVIALTQAAAAALVVRDADAGFVRVPVEQRTQLSGRAETLAEHVADLCDGWPRIAVDEPRLGGLRGGELLLLALAAGPALDRSVARVVRRALSDEPLTIGGLIDLAGADLDTRLALALAWERAEPLLARGLVHCADAEPTLTSVVAVAPWVVARLRRS